MSAWRRSRPEVVCLYLQSPLKHDWILRWTHRQRETIEHDAFQTPRILKKSSPKCRRWHARYWQHAQSYRRSEPRQACISTSVWRKKIMLKSTASCIANQNPCQHFSNAAPLYLQPSLKTATQLVQLHSDTDTRSCWCHFQKNWPPNFLQRNERYRQPYLLLRARAIMSDHNDHSMRWQEVKHEKKNAPTENNGYIIQA